MLTNAQIATLKTFVNASTDPAIIAARQTGATYDLMNLLNAVASPVVSSWRVDVAQQDIDEACDWTLFDAISAGKRDSWGFFLFRNRNFAKNKVRKWLTDVWGNATANSVSEAVLLAAVEAATVAQGAIGGVSRTTGTVTALDRGFTGMVTEQECQKILAA